MQEPFSSLSMIGSGLTFLKFIVNNSNSLPTIKLSQAPKTKNNIIVPIIITINLSTFDYPYKQINQAQKYMEKQQKYDSIRTQEQEYEKQIRETYKEHGNLFVNHSSDLLNLSVVSKEKDGENYETVVAKNGFEKYDIIAQIRGSLIKFDKLQKLITGKTVDPLTLPLLLYLRSEENFLISPKNITKYFFTNPLYRLSKVRAVQLEPQKRNCYIQSHFGSKLFISALRPIVQGEQLVLEQKSIKRYVYDFESIRSE